MRALSDALGPSEEPPVGDVTARRAGGHRMMDHIAATTAPIDGVDSTPLTLPGSGGAELEATWYRSSTAQQPGSAVLYLHGGGMIFSLAEMGKVYDLMARRYVAASTVPMLVVDYRVAPEHPHPTPVEDCYAALEWLAGQADALGFDPNRLALMGDSAGGGLAAGVSLMARDRGGPALAAQLLIYPMLDDRTTSPDPAISSSPDVDPRRQPHRVGCAAGTVGPPRQRFAVRGAGTRGRPLGTSPRLSGCRRPRPFPRRGPGIRAQALRRRGAHRISPSSGLSARLRGIGLRNRRGLAHAERPHPPTESTVTTAP